MENPFSRYPGQGRQLLGRPRGMTGACRSGYGLSLQLMTGQTACAYCGTSLVDTFQHWLLMSVDHVVPRGEALRLGIDISMYEDAINLVLCCAGCNGFGNRYQHPAAPNQTPDLSLDAFLELRDRIFADRFARIAARRAREEALFESRPWNPSDLLNTA